VALRTNAGHGLLFLEVSRSHTQRRITVGRTPLDEWSARRRDHYLTKHNTHNRQTSMPTVGFEPTISAGERPQTYASDRAATGTGCIKRLHTIINANMSKLQERPSHLERLKMPLFQKLEPVCHLSNRWSVCLSLQAVNVMCQVFVWRSVLVWLKSVSCHDYRSIISYRSLNVNPCNLLLRCSIKR